MQSSFPPGLPGALALFFVTSPAWAACPSGYTYCNAGSGLDMCTRSGDTVSCDLARHAGSGNTELWAVSPAADELRVWGSDESAALWCCEFTGMDTQPGLYVYGTPQIDEIDLNSSTDHLAGMFAVIYGYASADTITASTDTSCSATMNGGDGDDSFFGFDGAETAIGGSGVDTFVMGPGDDIIYGDEGSDVIRAGAGDDYIEAGADHDRVKGEAGADEIYGGDGNDMICGGDGDDYSVSGAGDDAIFSGGGWDYDEGDASTECTAGPPEAGRPGCSLTQSSCPW